MESNLSEWKNKIVRYLVQSHLGYLFRDGTIDPKQISVNISSGHAYLRCLELDVEFLNEVGDQLNFPLRIVRGYLKELHINAPWRSYWCDGLSLVTEFHGLHLTLEPKEDIDDAASMWSSAIGRLVEKSNTFKNDAENPVLLNEGAKKVDDFFRYLMSKLTIHFKDTVICLQPRNSELGIKLTIKLESLRFYDEHETTENVPEREYEAKTRGEGSHSNSAYTTKIVDIHGVSLWISEVPNELSNKINEHNRIEGENKNEIMFAVLNNKQKIKVFIRQADHDEGPGLWVQTELGDLIIFLTPRQIHLLAEFLQEYCKNEDDDRVQTRNKRVPKAMTDSDFQKLETVLQQQTYHPNTQYTGLQMGYGWSSEPTDGTEEQFYSMSGNQSDGDCAISLLSSSMESPSLNTSVHSTTYSERPPSTIGRFYGRSLPNNYPRAMSCASSAAQRPSYDPGREIFLIDLHISSLAVILLHEDILNVTKSGETYSQDSISKLQELSSNFLRRILQTNLSFLLQSGRNQVKTIFDNACQLNHIRLISSPVSLSFEVDPQKKKCDVSFKTYDLSLSECLFESNISEEVPLLIFEEPLQECLCISLVKHKKYNSQSNLVVTIRKCTVELDITIIDRLSALLNLPLFCQAKNSSSRMQPKHTTHFEIDIPYANFKLRFPIPDFSPLHDPKRVPWWKRNVRSDYMTLKCNEFKFETDFCTQKKSQIEEYSFRFEVVDIYYNESSRTKPIFFAQIGDRDQKYEEFIIKILPTAKFFNIEEQDDPVTRNTFSENFLKRRDNGPFSSKIVVHQSSIEHIDDEFPDSESLIPGDHKEIQEFKTTSSRSAKLIITIVLSSVKIQIISKHTYEMIYNRINNDLLTWESSAPKSRFTTKNDMFDDCKSGGQYVNSDSDSDDFSERDDDGLFYSTHGGSKLPNNDSSSTLIKKYVDQSKLVIDVKIVNGTTAFNPPVRDGSSNNVIPGQLGYFAIDVSEACIFMVTGYKGDRALDYICIDVRSCDMRHHEMMPSSEVKVCLPDLRRIPSHLYPVISKSVGALVGGGRKSPPERQMLTVACRILTKHETHHVKTVQIALGLNRSTLHHRMTAEPNSWISQLIDFFKVTDFPINGYKSKDVLSEFHLHTWDCAIDYRPLYLPLRCAVTLGSFNMTSNVSEISKGSKLRFLAEDCDLYISQENPPKDGVASNIPINIRREYINIITMNIFELSLVMNDKHNKAQPRLDLRVTTDNLKIHTCSDSLKALTELIGYIAADGDLMSNASSESNSPYPSPRHGPGDQELITVDPQTLEICDISERQRQEINCLIGEAIGEEEEGGEEKKRKKYPKSRGKAKGFLSQIQNELGDFNSSDDDIEKSFCIIDEEHDWGLNLRHTTPEIEWLTDEPFKIMEDYFFAPVAKKDLLKTPANFPVPVNKYTLCELNVIWQLYGGRDFQKLDDRRRDKREQYFNNEAYSHFSSTESIYSRSSSSSSSCRERNSENNWKGSGGIDRNKDVLMEVALNKVRCQFDVYPETTHHAHRFVLQIKGFEISDKMKSSEFNKFLCQYTSESTPVQSQGHMFVVEAVNIRPADMMGETECSLRLSLLPLRFYIDQESLEFLMKFFSELGHKSEEEKGTVKASSKHSTPIHQPPKLVVKNREEKCDEPQNDGEENLINLENSGVEERSSTPENELPADTSSRPLYFRPVSFGPESFVKIDYKGKHVGVADGSVTGMIFGLIMGLAEINNSEIKLKRLCHRHGILGLDKVFNHIVQEWLNDIKQNQIKNVLISVGPMQSVVQLFGGVRDLFWLPIEQYQKDGRIVKGLRKGANKFTTSTALAALELTFKFFHLLQVTAETAYDILSPGPSVRQITNAKKKKKHYTQPQDIREGVSNALWLVKEGFGETAQTIVQVATQEREQKGVVGVVGGLARQIPPNLIKPIIIASEATNNVLGGIRSQLVPDAKTEANQKWRNNFD